MNSSHKLTSILLGGCLASATLSAQLVADLRGDFVGAGTTFGQTSATTGISDTNGNGSWNYYSFDDTVSGATVNWASASLTLHQWGYALNQSSTGDPGYVRAPVDVGVDDESISPGGITDTSLYSSLADAPAGYLFTHPHTPTVGALAVWEVGAKPDTFLNIDLSFYQPNVNGDGVTVSIYRNGDRIFNELVPGTQNTAINRSIAAQAYDVGDKFYISVIDGGANIGSDATYLKATFTAVPEPASYGAFVGLLALASVVCLRRRSR